MGLIDEMSHALVDYYRQRLDPKVDGRGAGVVRRPHRQRGTG